MVQNQAVITYLELTDDEGVLVIHVLKLFEQRVVRDKTRTQLKSVMNKREFGWTKQSCKP